MEMEVVKIGVITVEMSLEELVVLHKLLGEVNGDFEEEAGLMKEEADISDKIYDYLDNFLDEEVDL
jgi:hypothetical protein